MPSARSAAKPASAPGDAAGVPIALAVSPHGFFHLDATPPDHERLPPVTASRVTAAFAASPAEGLILLGTALLSAELPPSLAFGREIGKAFFTHLCNIPEIEAERAHLAVPAPVPELEALAAAAPPMTGAEYLSADVLAAAWASIEAEVQCQIAAFEGTVEAYLRARSPLWNAVGRVHFHLAENKRSEGAPFAFLATYASRLGAHGRLQHAPLGRAIQEYAGARDRQKLLALLGPVHKATEKSAYLKALVDAGELYQPLQWTPREAFDFVKDIPAYEESGVIVHLPDWWHANRRPLRPEVRVTLGSRRPSGIGVDAMLDFQMALSLDGEPLTAAEARRILASAEPLVLIRGKWVEVDADKLREVLDHWKKVEADAASGLSFLEGMRLLAGARIGLEDAGVEEAAAWTRVTAGPWLDELLAQLASPEGRSEADPGDALQGTLRPYQRAGVAWLWLLSRLRLGACLADDMGLGKTIQVLSLLILLEKHGVHGPHLVVCPASLLGNWRAEAERFAPGLSVIVAHPSAMSPAELAAGEIDGADVILTTYGTVLRVPWFKERRFGLVALDEAQAIKNADAKQTRAVKAIASDTRLALTGTPVENRVGDLWSIFDFLCPGLLGTSGAFRKFTKELEADPRRGYAPLRALVRPYILRRMKSDKRIIADLPDKTEVPAFCSLTKTQAALYARSVEELRASLDSADDGIKRRGVILAYMMRFKQICNHPSQWLGDGAYKPEDSGKLARLRELAEPIAARQDKLLVFTQFREMTGPLSSFLAGVFGRPGLVLHGETPVQKRPSLVADFQREDGPPFFVLSLKAGGTGLNLTAASHVVHFDRWWNPAVENQATDRAYRIGQKRNVLVHKFVCKGTVEERIDELLADKKGLAEELLAGSGEAWITEMGSEELMRLVSLDLTSALEEG